MNSTSTQPAMKKFTIREMETVKTTAAYYDIWCILTGAGAN
ncbi:hypothetical protein NR800_29270 [Corallococcus interemptor]|nr:MULTISPECIES: hypothetical protein [unclassified Corallococcus]